MGIFDFFHFRRPGRSSIPPAAPAIRGVNLGGWLVLEKWMTPSLFPDGISHEYELCFSGGEAVRMAIGQHRDSFITLEDFRWLQRTGITAVRLPVGYWVFGGAEPYIRAAQYVDKAFAWASQTGIKILLDLHVAPGSQNGYNRSGGATEAGWHTDESNIIRTLEVVRRLAERYKNHPCLLGVELLNEPSPAIPRRTLLKYYRAAYQIIRDTCGPEPWVVFSDTFKPRRWKRALRGGRYQGVYIDSHQYQVFTEKDKRLLAIQHIAKTLGEVAGELRAMAAHHPVIVGEWSAALNPQSVQGLDAVAQETARRGYAAAELLTYDGAAAWFFWSYKTESGGGWSFRDCVERGWLPMPKP